MSHEKQFISAGERLVYMANQIAGFFASQPESEQVEGIGNHINQFWEPRMRTQLFEIVDAGGKGLSPLVLKAARHIRRPEAA
ncbi:formate dehydrogenase subunit delta [Nitratireductor indicus]|uniref:formate dehydrogenase subunit delta n=1 Tax=Nitratireductor indicus TaxID=721133 RepID=UPI002875AFEE|nr:formate dehydrogenase subunit delta [Nitratireductor indicus]MDS1137179.1 formate dehydrogenase subunit delta [Nitratireductor indicus]